jgi:hypothetical protein
MASRTVGARRGRPRHHAHSAASAVTTIGTASHTAQATLATLLALVRSPSAQRGPGTMGTHQSSLLPWQT